jgi:hypothetical protein
MSRGPPPQKGIDIALPAALARGFVIFCRHYYGYVCDLIIAEIGRTSIVRVVRTRCMYDTVAGMAVQLCTAISGLCRMPRDPCRSLEVWAADYYGNLRFFRVLGSGIVEISRNGTQLDPAALPEGAVKNPLPGKGRVSRPKGKKAGDPRNGGVPTADGGVVPG